MAAIVDDMSRSEAARVWVKINADGIILTPRCAAVTNEGAMRMSDDAAQNVLDFFSGHLRPEMVDFAP